VFQAEMVPVRPAKMNAAERPFPPFPTGKDEVLTLLTWPVGPWDAAAVTKTSPAGGLMFTLLTFVGPVTP
jgi:hypothetical protein